MRNTTKFLIATATATLCCLGASAAKAFDFTETKDAGDLMKTAIDVGTVGTSSQINGEIVANKDGSRFDIDLFRFAIDKAATYTFDANPVKGGSQLNINTFLFNASGNPISDVLEPREEDPMSFSMAINPGVYFLGIGSDDLDALDKNGNIILGNDTGILNAKGILAGWADPGKFAESVGKYNIKISAAPDTAIPTPALLPGLIAFGIKTLRKKGSATDA
jgi:hypothetical protein